MYNLIAHYRLPVIFGLVIALSVSVGALFFSRSSGADTQDDVAAFETIDANDLGLGNIVFRRAELSEAEGAMTEEEIRAMLGPAVDLPMREDAKLVQLVGRPFPTLPEDSGPFWAFLPDIPPPGLGPIPDGVETFFLQLYDAKTGELMLEFGGPIRDGENEWHPDFPEELRYDIEDQIR